MKHPLWDLQPAETKLLPDQRQHFIEMLKQVGWQKTGKDIFESILFPLFPAVASECAIVRDVDNVPHVLLWYREDEYYKGHHMPGKYLLRGEDDESWIRRSISNETGLALKQYQFIRRFNTRPETGWVPGQQIAHFWYCEAEGEPSNGKFYPLTALPEDTLGHHKKYVEYLRAFLMRRNTMRKVGIWHDGKQCASEWKWLCYVLHFSEPDSPVIVEYETLDEALNRCNQWRGEDEWNIVHLYDDMGQQIA